MAEAALTQGATATLIGRALHRHAASRADPPARATDLMAAALVSTCIGATHPDACRIERVAMATTLGGDIRPPGDLAAHDAATAALLTAARARLGGLRASHPIHGPAPVDVCAAAAWCAGLQAAASWPDMVAAFAAGLEAQQLLAGMLLAVPGGADWDVPSMTAVIGAGCAAGLLAGLCSDRLLQATGIAASQTVGTPLMTATPAGVMHAARPAANGVLAAALAAAGYTGPREVLEVHRGFFAVLARSPAPPVPCGSDPLAALEVKAAPRMSRPPQIAALQRLVAQLDRLNGAGAARLAVLDRMGDGTS